MAPPDRIRVAQIGYGYWGTNLARNAAANPDMALTAICDLSEENRSRAKQAFPNVKICGDSAEVLEDPHMDAVIVVTPAGTHAEICSNALKAGKHVLVTKPLATSVDDARRLADAADAAGRTLLVDHTFLYAPAVTYLKRSLSAGDLGRVLYYDSMRTGLGIFKTDANIVDDLAIHDLAILEYLFEDLPTTASAVVVPSFDDLRENLAYITLRYESGLVAHLGAHWLSPLKQRQVVIAGDAKMLVWDDGRRDERIRIFDSGIDRTDDAVVPGRANVIYRQGDAVVPSVSGEEALATEMADFVHSIRGRSLPLSNARRGLRVMQVVAAIHRSASMNGAPVDIRD
jgi:predicted dehydrogenase